MRKRNVKKQFWLDSEEAKELSEKALKSKICEADFVRLLIKGIVPKEAPPADFFEFIRQLRILNNNANQIATQLNARGLADMLEIRKMIEDNHRLEKTVFAVYTSYKEES